MNTLRALPRQYGVAVRAMLLLTLALGILYPLLVTGIGQLALPSPANGSLVTVNGTSVGSSLIGQSFTDAKGKPLPQWFQSRPSAAGAGYDATSSGGSNLGPSNPALLTATRERIIVIEKSDGVTATQIPPDAVSASASGLDPHISPAYALLQVDRVASARHLPKAAVRALVESKIQGRVLGYLGDPTVNVLHLNTALAEMDR